MDVLDRLDPLLRWSGFQLVSASPRVCAQHITSRRQMQTLMFSRQTFGVPHRHHPRYGVHLGQRPRSLRPAIHRRVHIRVHGRLSLRSLVGSRMVHRRCRAHWRDRISRHLLCRVDRCTIFRYVHHRHWRLRRTAPHVSVRRFFSLMLLERVTTDSAS
jgi:hypothetical protein